MGKSINDYIVNIQDKFGYAKDITVEHRSNNSKRDFLFCNKLQGKHIPVDPNQVTQMVDELVKQIREVVNSEKVVVIGFAETATCLGNMVASSLGCKYVMQTTRENCEPKGQLIEFSEEHSHATQQKLYGKLHKIAYAEYILFVEDEISTGKTILNFIKEFNRIKPGLKYGVASICNWQTQENKSKYKELGIDTFALVYGEVKDISSKMDVTLDESSVFDMTKQSFVTDTSNVTIDTIDTIKMASPILREQEKYFLYERTGHKWNDTFYRLLSINIARRLQFLEEKGGSILVLGTEEFMYVPYRAAQYFSNYYDEVKFHATTRSSIDIMKNPAEEGLSKKFKVHSAYEENRDTYIYNLKSYDRVVILTDSDNDNAFNNFVKDIVSALVSVGNSNKHIHIFRIK